MAARTILIVDDDPMLRTFARKCLENHQFHCIEADTAEGGYEVASSTPIDALLLDIRIPKMGGEVLLRKLADEQPQIPLIVLTIENEAELAVRCLKAGARDFLNKPCTAERLLTTVTNVIHTRTLEQRVRELDSSDPDTGFDQLFGKSASMLRVFDQLKLLAANDTNVLIEGTTGSGKELVARALHRRGPRAKGPFIALNCGAIPESLLESELFGHEKGAFTGAISSRAGCFEQADSGTLFLDEIGEMRIDMQVRLLRVLETREVQRLGANKTTHFDVRVLCATNRNLRKLIDSGKFRQDLYYRLAVYRLKLPNLCERDGDVLDLAQRFMIQYATKMNRTIVGFDERATRALEKYDWPGNVRELRNAMEHACLVAKGPQIGVGDLPEEVQEFGKSTTYASPPDRAAQEKACLAGSSRPDTDDENSNPILTLEEEESRIIERVLRRMKGDVTETALALGIGRSTLYRRMKQLNLTEEGQDECE